MTQAQINTDRTGQTGLGAVALLEAVVSGGNNTPNSQPVTHNNVASVASTPKKHPFAERTAFNLGFRVSACGKIVTGPDGKARGTYLDTSGYFRLTILLPTGRRNLSVHRLQAFQKFGDAMFGAGIEVRHLSGVKADNSSDNIGIGDHSANMMDRPAWMRVKIAGNANRKFDAAAVRAFYNTTKSYKATMAQFGIPSKGTLHHIINRPASEQLTLCQEAA